MTRRVLFTAITGGYEKLNELPAVARGSIDAFCFTDDETLTSESWTVVHVRSPFPLDPIRSQRSIKILQHDILRGYHETLYIDNSVLLKVDPHQILDEWLNNAEIAMPEHSYRENVAAEFDAIIEHRLDSTDRVLEQRSHYAALYPEALSEKPLWNALIARRNTTTVGLFEQIWFDHVLRYARRDQLSTTVAASISHVRLNRVELDNFDSPLHSWPVLNERKSQIRHGFWPDSHELKLRLTESETAIADLTTELTALKESKSWKLTRPLRQLTEWLARLRKP